MNTIVNNRYIDALLKLMLLSAVLHVAILIFYSILNLNISLLNFFKIIGADLFFPQMAEARTGVIYGLLVGIVLYLVIYLFFTQRKSLKNS